MKVVVKTVMQVYEAHALAYTLGYMRKYLARYPSFASTFKTYFQPDGYTCWIRRGWAPVPAVAGGTTWALVSYSKVFAVDPN